MSSFGTSLASFLLLGCFALGCDRPESEGSPDRAAETSSPTSVDANATDLYFVWIGEDGDFHTSARSDDIPSSSRALVRVLSDTVPSGTHDQVYVADLNAGPENGRYALRAFPRSEWESRGAEARKARVAAVTPEPEKPLEPAALGALDAVVYGADWCKPCHQAEDYLKSKGVRVVKKDIEEDPNARAEMRKKLSGAGLSGSSIPVLDVAGTVLVGFSTSAVDAALRRASAKK